MAIAGKRFVWHSLVPGVVEIGRALFRVRRGSRVALKFILSASFPSPTVNKLPLLLVLVMLLATGCASTPPKVANPKPLIQKLGTLDHDIVESTPIVWHGRLYRFEWWRNEKCFRFVHAASGKTVSTFANGYEFGTACVDRNKVYVFGTDKGGGTRIDVFWSTDLKNWTSQTALELPGWGIFNESVCRAADRWVMAFEIDKPADETGVPFTTRFAESSDLIHWKLTPPDCVFAKDRYTACPTLRFLGGVFYMFYLESKPGWNFETCVVRSRDLIHWDSSPFNPVMRASAEDKLIANERLTAGQVRQIAAAVDINNSDFDLCEFGGNVVINYSWGNQRGNEFLAAALYRGTLKDFLIGWFPQPK